MKTVSLAIRDRVAVVTFDQPDRKVNILTLDAMEELSDVLDRIRRQAEDLKGTVFLSAKESNFIAGADLSLIEGITDPAEGATMARRGQEIFERIRTLPMATVAAIHGSCLGGGLELALSCRHRVASDARETAMGLPETQLGIIPGFGGTQLLPLLIGLVESVRMITTGATVYPLKAFRIGLVDEITKREYLMDAALAAVAGNLPVRPKAAKGPGAAFSGFMEGTLPGRIFLLEKARKAVLAATRGHYPAPLAAIDSIGYGLRRGIGKGLVEESRIFGLMAVTDVSKNLLKVFRLRESFAKGDPAPGTVHRNITVVGGGAMGGGIAALAAEHGLHVRLVDTSEKALGDSLRSLTEDVSEKRRRGRYTRVEADWIPTRLTVDTQMRGIGGSEALIEAVVERMDVKKAVFSSAAQAVGDSTLLLTNTSSLSVTELARSVEHPERVAGMHFFNPVDRMPLVEVVRGEKTSGATVDSVRALARRLGKIPVTVKDRPGFLVNRLLLPYLNEAAHLLEEGAEPGSVDEALLDFGMPMGAFILLDQVGLDIVVHAGRSLFEGFGERMAPSPILAAMVDAGRLGKKSGKGFYLYDDAGDRHPDPGIAGILERHMNGKRSFSQGEIVDRLLYPMINEAVFCLEEKVAESPEAVEAAMILGAGFPPFRGGLLRYADSVGIANIVEALERLARRVDERFSPSERLREMAGNKGVFFP